MKLVTFNKFGTYKLGQMFRSVKALINYCKKKWFVLIKKININDS